MVLYLSIVYKIYFYFLHLPGLTCGVWDVSPVSPPDGCILDDSPVCLRDGSHPPPSPLDLRNIISRKEGNPPNETRKYLGFHHQRVEGL